mmetsp:Transcript_25226/g.64111  ORF Transcript_25226/g.64111 Transcript_25226/m.64111 type:complete len:203 (+) Transcript_25226:1597-2205(+)
MWVWSLVSVTGLPCSNNRSRSKTGLTCTPAQFCRKAHRIPCSLGVTRRLMHWMGTHCPVTFTLSWRHTVPGRSTSVPRKLARAPQPCTSSSSRGQAFGWCPRARRSRPVLARPSTQLGSSGRCWHGAARAGSISRPRWPRSGMWQRSASQCQWALSRPRATCPTIPCPSSWSRCLGCGCMRLARHLRLPGSACPALASGRRC